MIPFLVYTWVLLFSDGCFRIVPMMKSLFIWLKYSVVKLAKLMEKMSHFFSNMWLNLIINAYHAELISGNIKMYLDFLSFVNHEIVQVVEILQTRSCLTCIVNSVAADDLVTQGARALAAMVLTKYPWNNSGSTWFGITMMVQKWCSRISVMFVFFTVISSILKYPFRVKVFNYRFKLKIFSSFLPNHQYSH